MKFKLSLIAALSLLTCPVSNCGVFSKFVTSARGAFSRPTFSFKSFAPKTTLCAGALSTYRFFKPAVVRAEDKDTGFTQEEKLLVFKALCKKGDYDEKKLEKAPISCKCYRQLEAASRALGAKMWGQGEELIIKENIEDLASSAQRYTKCEKYNELFKRYFDEVLYRCNVQFGKAEQHERDTCRRILDHLMYADRSISAISARIVLDALKKTPYSPSHLKYYR